MDKENYSICSIFPLQQGISRAKLFGYTHFPQPPESNVCPQKCLQGGSGIVLLSILHGYWGLHYLLNLSITKENLRPKLFGCTHFATPGKQCLPLKVSLGGLRDRTLEYTI